MNKKRMVVGFAFNDFDLVWLIRKNRPAFQEGLLNGIGGHVEEGEEPEEAMIREFEEEAGLRVEDWTHVAVLEGDNWYLDVFATQLLYSQHYKVKTMTDEKVDCYYINRLFFESTLPNVRFLVPMCREHLDNEYTFLSAHLVY